MLSINKVPQIVIVAASVLLAGVVSSASNRLASLNDAVDGGSVAIESMSGTGGSSGAVLNAVLVNETEIVQRILVHLDVPLFFQNRGHAQNMVATQVYGRDGKYWQRNNGVPYVEVAAGSKLPVTFIAYCADFEKDNPSFADAFDVAPLPQRVAMVMRQISAYETANRDVDTTKASQLALWVVQSHTLGSIGEKFRFDARDKAIMHEIFAMKVD